jgi:hypothetical protein
MVNCEVEASIVFLTAIYTTYAASGGQSNPKFLCGVLKRYLAIRLEVMSFLTPSVLYQYGDSARLGGDKSYWVTAGCGHHSRGSVKLGYLFSCERQYGIYLIRA